MTTWCQSELKGAETTMKSLDDGSETKNSENDEINGEEDVSQHGDDTTKAADEEWRREGVGYCTGIACFHLSTTGGFYTKSTARAENKEASRKGKEIPKESGS